MGKSIIHFWCGVALLLIGAMFTLAPARAEIVGGQLPDGTGVAAEYYRGVAGRHAVLVLHGFMTTRDFNTVQSMVNELAGLGYTVLAPTLSLGVSNRRASVPCDAFHTHTWEDDIAEIDFWVDWLVKQGHESVVLVGHSTGSLQLLDYIAGQPASQVRKLVATSLVNIRRYTEPAIADKEMAAARELLDLESPPLREYHLAFCDNFTATPQSYLSYIRWDRERVLQTLDQVKVPLEVIMGGADRRFSSDWTGALKSHGTKVVIIDGASHFFDATHEFDLLDKLQACLEGVS